VVPKLAENVDLTDADSAADPFVHGGSVSGSTDCGEATTLKEARARVVWAKMNDRERHAICKTVH